MKHKGPVITLLAGLTVALVLLVVNMNATKRNQDNRDAASNVAAGTPATTPAAPPPTTAPAAPVKVTFAGSVEGSGGSLAIAVNNGTAIAYLCDGKRTEAWLQGIATDGKLTLTGAKEASIAGTFGNGAANGTITVAGRTLGFALKAVKAPSGLYRSTANVRNATVVGGWIVLANGRQVGVLNVAGEPEPAPELNIPAGSSTGTATVDGTQITAVEVDGSHL
jgi:serine/threonine-protein kinase